MSKLFGVFQQTISKWMRLHREQGASALKARPRGRAVADPRETATDAVRVIEQYNKSAKRREDIMILAIPEAATRDNGADQWISLGIGTLVNM